jgi:hypothetical protein
MSICTILLGVSLTSPAEYIICPRAAAAAAGNPANMGPVNPALRLIDRIISISSSFAATRKGKENALSFPAVIAD